MYKDKIASLKRRKAALSEDDYKNMPHKNHSQNLDSWIQYFETKQKQWERAVKR